MAALGEWRTAPGDLSMPVLILGSKPAPRFPRRFETVVYANGAILHSGALRASQEGRLEEIHVLSNSLLSDKNALCTETRELLRGRSVDRTYLIEFRPPDEVTHSLDEIGYRTGALHEMSRREKEGVTRGVLGRTMPWHVARSRWPISAKIGFARHYLRTRELHVSTGVLALLLAVHAGVPGPYVLAGIGMADSGYAYTARQAARGHLINDAAAFDVLRQGRLGDQIFTTEPDLAAAVGLALWTDDS